MTRFQHIRKNVFCMTQAEFADLLGIRQGAVSMLESRDALPERHQRTIREAAKRRGIEWNDTWFFEPPADH